ncbi:MAG: carboxypeptidase-like regulatory domain-containing protein, partial [Cyanobacteria bacterium J06639_1]
AIAGGEEPEIAMVAAGIPALQRVRLTAGAEISAPTVASAATGSVAGRVLNVAGVPVRDGQIRLSDAANPDRDRQLNLLPDGSFFIPNLPAGTYLADVTVADYPPASTQIQVRSGFVSSQVVRLSPGRANAAATGIGVLPDSSPFSDELAYRVQEAIAAAKVPVEGETTLLIGPLGPAPEFEPVLPALRNMQLIDRDERFTADLDRLKAAGNALGLRYILLARMEVSTDFNRAGNPWVNLALQYFVPSVPISLPNFTPNQLRSRGIITLVDLQDDEPGDRASYYEAFGRDDVGGSPMFDEAAAGLYRQQVQNMVPEFLRQWQEQSPFS